MQKNAFTLIEVIISISLLSVVIITVLKIKENNFDRIEKLNVINKNIDLLSVASVNMNTNNSINKHFYLNKIIESDNNHFNKVLKNTKIYKKSEIIKSNKIENKTINIIKTNFKIQNKASMDIYTFKIESN